MILLCNDDGFNAEGLRVLRKELLALDDVTIVAPEKEQSAMGHAITLNQPLKVRSRRGSRIYRLCRRGYSRGLYQTRHHCFA